MKPGIYLTGTNVPSPGANTPAPARDECLEALVLTGWGEATEASRLGFAGNGGANSGAGERSPRRRRNPPISGNATASTQNTIALWTPLLRLCSSPGFHVAPSPNQYTIAKTSPSRV
ncbi:hypothetical protein [Oryza sativa Japonica Group]|uniref:DUF1263 domain-containing protein n=1 Tax=Oryza sativa subsp. japonica TaxID=39947 RepID=Q5JJZ7_ORYSJ|nr:hypothetical protein [Oryza sativa Japonica Group]